MYNNKPKGNGTNGPRPQNEKQSYPYASDRHWITRLKELSRKETIWLNDEDIGNIWFLYSSTNGLFRRWLSDGTLLDRLRREQGSYHDMESVKCTVRKISDNPGLKKIVTDAR
jgi:hypothetical protein